VRGKELGSLKLLLATEPRCALLHTCPLGSIPGGVAALEIVLLEIVWLEIAALEILVLGGSPGGTTASGCTRTGFRAEIANTVRGRGLVNRIAVGVNSRLWRNAVLTRTLRSDRRIGGRGLALRHVLQRLRDGEIVESLLLCRTRASSARCRRRWRGRLNGLALWRLSLVLLRLIRLALRSHALRRLRLVLLRLIRLALRRLRGLGRLRRNRLGRSLRGR
jgi:hypothetical protein